MIIYWSLLIYYIILLCFSFWLFRERDWLANGRFWVQSPLRARYIFSWLLPPYNTTPMLFFTITDRRRRISSIDPGTSLKLSKIGVLNTVFHFAFASCQFLVFSECWLCQWSITSWHISQDDETCCQWRRCSYTLICLESSREWHSLLLITIISPLAK